MSKKLPKLWVAFDASGVEWASIRKPKDAGFQILGTLYRYAPVQHCLWTEDESGEYWYIGCLPDTPYQIEPATFCQFCGGNIKTEGAK